MIAVGLAAAALRFRRRRAAARGVFSDDHG